MNKTTAITGGIIIALLVIGGVVMYASQNTSSSNNNATSTPTTGDQNDTTPIQAQKPGTPSVTTSASVFSSDTVAVLNGSVIPNGAFTSYWYEYGTSASLGNKISSPSQTVGSGFALIGAPGYVTGLVKNTTYYFRLVAENQYGRITGSQYSFKTTEGNPPPVGSAPTIKTMAANGISRTTANLNGEVTPNKASTQYWFEYGKSSNLGNATELGAVGNGTEKLPASKSLSNLDPLTTYYFRINAQNQFGTVNGTILNFKTAGPPAATAPSATTRTASDVSTSTATLRGTVNPNRSETAYWFEYSTDSLLGSVLLSSTGKTSAGAGSSTISIEADVSGLSRNTNYYFRLVTQNSVGTVRGERMTFKTK